MKVGIVHLPNIHHSIISKNTFYFNIVVAGGSGNGKTRFIQYLMKTKLKQSLPTLLYDFDFKKSVSASKKMIIDDQYLDFEEYRFLLEDSNIKVNVKIVEITNIGDRKINNNIIGPIINFIEREYDLYYTIESANSAQIIKDNRIHLFLYFFDALSPRAIDLKVLNTINYYVNVVPCCAFADILSKEEKELILKSEIYRKIKFFNKTPIQFISEPKRKYQYGKSNSEFTFSKNFLRDNLLSLIDSTDVFYQSYKRKRVICDILKKHKNEIQDEDMIFLKKFIESDEVKN